MSGSAEAEFVGGVERGGARVVVHLLDWAECGPPVAWSIAALRARDGAGAHRVVLLGTARDRAAAERWLMGAVDAQRMMAGRGGGWLSLPRGVMGDEVAGVVAWSWRALRAAGRLAMGGAMVRGRLAGFGLRGCERGGERLVAGLARRGRMAFGSAWALEASGLGSVEAAGAAVLPLPVPMVGAGGGAGDGLSDRGWFGLEVADADERLTIAAVGWPGCAVSATRASYIAGVLAIGGHKSAAIVPRDAEDLERAARFAHRHGEAWPVFAVDGSDARAVSAADVALWCGHPGAMLEAAGRLRRGVRSRRGTPLVESLLLPLALGVPVVAESVAGTRELLGEGGRWLTPVGDRLVMNRSAFAMLTDLDGARTAFAARAAGIVAARSPSVFAEAFARWVAGWDVGSGGVGAGAVRRGRGATSS